MKTKGKNKNQQRKSRKPQISFGWHTVKKEKKTRFDRYCVYVLASGQHFPNSLFWRGVFRMGFTI
jgi:hypothetical protein